jgi:hypothetical protein
VCPAFRRHDEKDRSAGASSAQDQPRVFAPFTSREWVTAPDKYFNSCLEWPALHRVDPPVPPNADYPSVPTLVLAGDLDYLTSPETTRETAAAFPNSTYVEVANMTHVSALADYGRCASAIVRRFVRTLSAGDTSCAARYGEVRLVDRFAASPFGSRLGKASSTHGPNYRCYGRRRSRPLLEHVRILGRRVARRHFRGNGEGRDTVAQHPLASERRALGVRCPSVGNRPLEPR